MKKLEERDLYDLLNLSHELHCRSVDQLYNEEMHTASVNAKNELRSRLEEMIDALIEAYGIINDLKQGQAKHLVSHVELERIEQALTKAGVEL